jgi:hypothetical protein
MCHVIICILEMSTEHCYVSYCSSRFFDLIMQSVIVIFLLGFHANLWMVLFLKNLLVTVMSLWYMRQSLIAISGCCWAYHMNRFVFSFWVLLSSSCILNNKVIILVTVYIIFHWKSPLGFKGLNVVWLSYHWSPFHLGKQFLNGSYANVWHGNSTSCLSLNIVV